MITYRYLNSKIQQFAYMETDGVALTESQALWGLQQEANGYKLTLSEIQNMQKVDTTKTLEQAQSAKQSLLLQEYNQVISQGYVSSVDNHTYSLEKSARDDYMQMWFLSDQAGVADSATVTINDLHGTPRTMRFDVFKTIMFAIGEEVKRLWALYVAGREAVKAATTVQSAEAITVSYTS
jgi:hypothetical protein